VGGNLKVASFNVLNYFTTIDTGAPICGPLQNQECRGADTPEELARQRAKIVAALSAINADVVGLIEIENYPGNVPTADLVNGLNDMLGAGTYDFIVTGAIGTDAIRQALIYKPATVTPLGAFAILDASVDARFLDDYNRPALAQSFQDNATGGIFTVAVNHLKSKGSDCNDLGDPDLGDGAGNCNLTRLAAALALADWLATDPTGSGDADALIIGDLNSYDKEDPIDALLAAGYTDLLGYLQGEYAYSYVFDGQIGYLDYALANTALVDQVTGATAWHINADEPDLIDYDMSFKLDAQDALYAPDAYRASDHDAIIVGLNLITMPPTVEAGGPYAVSVNESILLSAVGFDPEGKPLSYAWDLDNDGIFETLGQEAWFTAGTLPGIFPVHVMVTDASGLTASDQTYVAVFDRNNGFVTGGGWIDSPAGAYTFDPLLTGKAEFSFDAKYVKKNAYPVASLSWLIDSAGLYFTGTSFDWLVVDGNSAWLRGSGEFNGMAGYTFLLSVVDGSEKLGGDGFDYVRLQIIEQVSGMLVYDSQPGSVELAPPATMLGGGSITIH
jgi:endonuclease/exonuclease/phosphatase family metal-dependent hydrolase